MVVLSQLQSFVAMREFYEFWVVWFFKTVQKAWFLFGIHQFSSVAQSCPTLCNPMNHSTQGLPVHHQLLESTQTHAHWVGDPSNHLILWCPLLLLPSIFPSIRVFSNESTLHIRWPKYWSFSFNISPSNEHPRLISFGMDWLDLLAVQGTLKSFFPTPQFKSISSSVLSFLCSPTLTSIHDHWKNHSLDYDTTTSWEKLGWWKPKLESILPGEISITSDMQMTPPLWQKAKITKEPLDESERGEWKSWLKAQHSENKDHGMVPSFHGK